MSSTGPGDTAFGGSVLLYVRKALFPYSRRFVKDLRLTMNIRPPTFESWAGISGVRQVRAASLRPLVRTHASVRRFGLGVIRGISVHWRRRALGHAVVVGFHHGRRRWVGHGALAITLFDSSLATAEPDQSDRTDEHYRSSDGDTSDGAG